MGPLPSLLFAFVLVPVGAGDEGFGGAPDEARAPDEAGERAPDATLADDVCTIKGDDGVWRACSDVLAAKQQSQRSVTDEALVDMSPEAQALRERMKAVDAAAAAERAGVGPAVPKTKLEEDLEKAHLDPTMPLLSVRVDVERARDVVKALEKKGTGGKAKDEAEVRVAEAELILDAVERIAIHRMDVCAQRRGNKPVVKNFRMTAAGPVMLSTPEMIARLPVIDPYGCERITLIDAELVTRVKRLQEVRRVLATTSFGYHDVAKRKALEKEQKELETALGKDAIPALSAPGVKDPYGR